MSEGGGGNGGEDANEGVGMEVRMRISVTI